MSPPRSGPGPRPAWLAPQGAGEQEAQADADQQGRDRVAADQAGDVLRHAAEVLVLEILPGRLQPAGDRVRGRAEEARLGGLLADRRAEVLHAAAGGRRGVLGLVANGR